MKLFKKKDITCEEYKGKISVGDTDGTRTILGTNGIKGGDVRFYMHCKECEKDPELYGEGIFELTRGQAVEFRGCGCFNVKHDEWQYKILVQRLCDEEGYTFHGWVGEYNGAKTKLKLTCSEGHYYESTSLAKFLRSGRRCPICAGNVPWNLKRFLSEAHKVHGDRYDYSLIKEVKNSKQKLPIICREHGIFYSDCHHHIGRGQDCPHPECCWKKISEAKAHTTEDFKRKAFEIHGNRYDYSSTVYDRSFTKLEIYCPVCEKSFEQTPADHLNGNGCPYCSGRNQRQCYIFLVCEDLVPLAIKIGKANVYTTRYSKQKRMSPLDVQVVGVWEFDENYNCKECEKYVKDNFNCGHLSKEQYPDGYSETLCYKHIEEVITVYEDFGGKRIV